MTAPAISGIHHVTLTVTDAPTTAEWYRDVLGFEILRQFEAEGLTKVMLTRAGVTIVLVHHGDKAVPGPFSERRNGLDHLSLAVADRAALETWAAHLDASGVVHSPVKEGSTGSLLAFRDPDNVAREFYTLD
jgi:catechol 2,3-dioxygenase-like lactoylglutathione lyase family enzyme